jgi:hypothetical protein
VQDLNGWGFGGLLSRMALDAVTEMGKTRRQSSKRNFTRETEGTLSLDLVGLLV